jgi:hypothetical protein
MGCTCTKEDIRLEEDILRDKEGLKGTPENFKRSDEIIQRP